MKFRYTKYKEMLSEIIAHIERDDKKFHSLYALMDYYCDSGIQYHNYACDYAYKKWNQYDRHMCFYCPLRFHGYVYCHDTINHLKWAYEQDKKDLCISLIKQLRDNVSVRKGVEVE